MRLLGWLLIASAWVTGSPAAAYEPCWQLVSPLARLACYDRRSEEPAVPRSRETQIPQKPEAPTPSSWVLSQDEHGLTLRRSVPGADVLIRCQHRITHLAIQLSPPWPSDASLPATQLDGEPQAVRWFLRQQQTLLESGRGLPAIAHLKRWQHGHQLQLSDGTGIRHRIPLDGLANALQPLRRECRW